MLKDKILEQLKNKYKSLGLSAKILEGFATRLAKTVTEEDKIEEAVNDVEPELQIWQSVLDANRKEVSDLKKQLADSKKTDPPKGDDPKPDPAPDPAPTPQPDDTPAWFKSYVEKNDQRFDNLLKEKQTNTRRSSYEALFSDVKDDKMKANKMAQFDRLNFKDDEDFNSFIESEKAYLDDHNLNVLKTGGLMKGQPTTGKVPDAELDAVVDTFKI